MATLPWTESLETIRDEFRRLAAEAGELRHGVVLLPIRKELPASELNFLGTQIFGREPCTEPRVLEVPKGQQVHYFHGDEASYDKFVHVAKWARDRVKTALKTKFPNLLLPGDLCVDDERFFSWIFLLYDRAWDSTDDSIAATWGYVVRKRARTRPADDRDIDFMAVQAINEYLPPPQSELRPSPPELHQWPKPSPYVDFELGEYISLVGLEDRLDGPRNKYWDHEEYPFPALFCAQLQGNLFDASAAAVARILGGLPNIHVNVAAQCATFKEVPYPLKSEEIATFLKLIVDACPSKITGAEMEEKSGVLRLYGKKRFYRLKKGVPASIRPFIQSEKSVPGYRWIG